jgi:hypothetical protein
LTQFARYDVGPEIRQRIQAFLSAACLPVTVADVMAHVAPKRPQSAIIPILHMAFHHELVLPLDHAPVSRNSPVMLASEASGGGEP